MDDITKQAAEVAAAVGKAQAEREQCLKDALAHEEEARKLRLRAAACKQEAATGQAALATLQVRQRVESHEAAAAKARGEAEANAAAAKKDRDEAAALLAAAKAAAPKPAAKDEATPNQDDQPKPAPKRK